MKICAIICEYNPFHNGHLYQLQTAKKQSGADAVVCFMSGNFVQRGEGAIMDKFTRAKHAVSAGADAVIELPTVFATSNAELFAKGGIHLLSSIPAIQWLCFGAEKADTSAFLSAAKYVNDEPLDVSKKIKTLTHKGMSYAQARAEAFSDYIPLEMLCSPNTILGVEYTRALLQKQSNVKILPIQRKGSGYNDTALQTGFSSASAIRKNLQKSETLVGYLPDFVWNDLPKQLEERLEYLEKYAILSAEKETIANVCDCTEGLENAFKKAATSREPLIKTLVSARYTASRIRRIALQNLLRIEKGFIRQCLQTPLYLRVLAAKKERTDVLSALSKSAFPLVVRAHDENVLSGAAKQCFETDIFAENIHRLLYDNQTQEKIIFF